MICTLLHLFRIWADDWQWFTWAVWLSMSTVCVCCWLCHLCFQRGGGCSDLYQWRWLSSNSVRARAYLDRTHSGSLQKWLQYTILQERLQLASEKETKITPVKKEIMWLNLKTDETTSTSKREVSVTKMTVSEILAGTMLPKRISWKETEISHQQCWNRNENRDIWQQRDSDTFLVIKYILQWK